MTESQDINAQIQPMRGRVGRGLFLCLGSFFVGLGVVGAFLPVLPTTPFMILAAACYARSSDKFYRKLIHHQIFGPPILEWQAHGTLSTRTKRNSVLCIILTFSLSIGFFVKTFLIQVLLLLIGLGVIFFLLLIPSRRCSAPKILTEN